MDDPRAQYIARAVSTCFGVSEDLFGPLLEDAGSCALFNRFLDGGALECFGHRMAA